MVGKLQDIVTAAAVVGAVEMNNTKRIKPDSSAAKVDIAPKPPVEDAQAKFVVDTQGMEAEGDALFKKEEEEQEFHLEPGTLDEESVSLMTEELNDLMSKINCNLEFTYSKEADMMSVKMVDKKTKEVIKELPPEEMIENMIKAKDWLGAFIDKNI